MTERKKRVKRGRPKTPKQIAETTLLRAIEKVAAEKGTHMLDHFVKRAYASDNVLIALFNKFIPNKIKGDPVIDNSTHKHFVVKVKKAYADRTRIQTPRESSESLGKPK